MKLLRLLLIPLALLLLLCFLFISSCKDTESKIEETGPIEISEPVVNESEYIIPELPEPIIIDLPELPTPITTPVIKESVIINNELNQLKEELNKQNTPKDRYNRYNSVTQYDQYFSKYSKRFFGPTFDHLWFKAQAIIESNLKPDATSPVGAGGLMQIMPGTWEDIRRMQSQIGRDRYNIEDNIAAGIFYMSDIWSRWKFKETWLDHMSFCLASYNAGRGNIIKAQTLAKRRNYNTETWESIVITLPNITGHHSKETINYVLRIKQSRRDLI